METNVGVAGAVVVLAASLFSGCMTSRESAERQRLTEHVGIYPPPPEGIDRPRVGVPPFESTGEGSSVKLNEIAADQMTTLAVNSDRFNVIERAQLNQLLREQGLQGIVRPDELARSGQVRGVDYLLFGKVTNFRAKAERASRSFRVGGVPFLGAFDFKRKDSTITVECGVDLRLVDATSGGIAAARSSDFKRTDTIGALGIVILGFCNSVSTDLQIDEDNKGLVLRLALDQALRDMLPAVDRTLLTRTREKKATTEAAAGS